MKNKNQLLAILATAMFCQLPAKVIAQKWPGIRDSVYSNVLKENRVIQVVLPKDYTAGSNQEYDVLYVLDGEWNMDFVPFLYNFAVGWGYLPQSIIVLIPNTYLNGINLRDRDFSPTQMKTVPNSGGAANFHTFLKSELIPYVEEKYPTNKQRSLLGSSFSGLFAIYSFLKEPLLFQSYVASDPNISWDKDYVSNLANEKLPLFSNVTSTLFIGGLETTFRQMGIGKMDSVLKAKAPVDFHWKCTLYANESHVSVQLKAFYDGWKFSHFGYSEETPEFHPMNGIVEKEKALKIYFANQNPTIRYTLDGTEPTTASAVMQRDESISILGTTQLRAKTFPYQKRDAKSITGNFKIGALPPDNIKSKNTAATKLNYSYFEGEWDKLPDLKKLKPVTSGIITSDFNINTLKSKNNAAYLAEGFLQIPEDGYYIFFANSKDGSKLYVANQLLIDYDGLTNKGRQTVVVPLKKGNYSLQLEIFRKKNSPDLEFIIFCTKPANDKWWETEFLKLSR